MKRNSEIIQIILNIKSLFRVCPYGRFLITVLPVFAILYQNSFINSVWSILLIIPFIIAMASGYVYNTICDAKFDPKEKNILARGNLSLKTSYYILIFSVGISLLLFLFLYYSITAIFLFLIYIFLWLAYSGIKIRFKENLLAPIVASIVLWIGAPVIILSEFNYFDNSIVLLITGFFFVYIGHEIKHTVIEYEIDKKFDCKTFAVLLDKKKAIFIEYFVLILGFLCLIMSLYYLDNTLNIVFINLFSFLFLCSILLIIYYGYQAKFNITHDSLFITSPYIIAKVFLIVYSCLIIGIPLLFIVFGVWIFLIDKYP